MTRPGLFLISLFACALPISIVKAQQVAPSRDEDLRFVVYLSRHGVRSPIGNVEQIQRYSASEWPKWLVPAGHLTPHGYRLMELFGRYDRMFLASEGLLKPTGCDEASQITIHADSDQRTRETGKALAAGAFPGCNITVQFLAEGTQDPLFNSVMSVDASSTASTPAAIAGRLGGDVNNLTAAYRSQLSVLDGILAKCGAPLDRVPARASLFDNPSTLEIGNDHVARLRGPVSTAATVTENFLLEYAEGMPAKDVGWGCIDGKNLRSLIDLHTASFDYAQRTAAVAQTEASNLLDQIDKALEQTVSGKPIPGAPSKVDDRVLFLVGHDTNIVNIAGLLGLTWIVDGRRDDTAPGTTLVFELWQDRSTRGFSIRTYLMVQTLEQMHTESALDAANPPARVPISIPFCSTADGSCPWTDLSRILRNAVLPDAHK